MNTMRDILNAMNNTWNTHDLDKLATLYAADYEGKDIGLSQTFYGQSGAREMAAGYYRTFPDLSFTLTQTIIEDDCAALAWISCGTHRGKIMNIPPTGRSIKVNGLTTLQIRDGLIIRSSVLWDVAGLLRDIGLLPDL